MHRFVLHNDRIIEASCKTLAPGQVGLLSGWGVFTTMKVAGGVPFAFERHWERMRRDAAALRVPFPFGAEEARGRLLKLIEANGADSAVLRVVVVRNRGGLWEGLNGSEADLIALTTQVKDWGQGAKLCIRPHGRYAASSYAGVKTTSWALNLAWLEEAQSKGFDEVILLNERGEVSECTSANIFVSRGNQVWTPPLTSGCLPGVTRQVILEEMRIPGIAIGEKTLTPLDLENADEIFITSTTRDLLLVNSIEGRPVKAAGSCYANILKEFRRYFESYIAARHS